MSLHFLKLSCVFFPRTSINSFFFFPCIYSSSTTTRRGRKLDLRDILLQGTEEDLQHLSVSLQQCLEGNRGPAFAFLVEVPDHYADEDAVRLKSFLQGIGFVETLIGENYVLRLPGAKVDELRRALLSIGNGSTAHSPSPSPTHFDSTRLTLEVPTPQVAVTAMSASEARRTRSSSANDAELTALQPLMKTRSFASQGRILAKPLSVITEVFDAGLAEVNDACPNTSSRLRHQALLFPPRARAFSNESERAESPAFSPFASSSPRFFGDADTDRNTPTYGNSPSFRDDEVYPQLGVGLQGMELGQSGGATEELQASKIMCENTSAVSELHGFVVSEMRPGQAQEVMTSQDSDGSTVLEDEEDEGIYDPDMEADTSIDFDRDINASPSDARIAAQRRDALRSHLSPGDGSVGPVDNHSPLAFTSALDTSGGPVPRPNGLSSHLRARSGSVTFDPMLPKDHDDPNHDHSGEGDSLDHKLLHQISRNSSSGSDASGQQPASPIFSSAWGALRRESDGSENSGGIGFLEGSSGGGSYFNGANRNSNGSSSSFERKKMLRRYATMPAMRGHSRPALHPGQQTPCGPSASMSATPGKFNTPQSRAESIILSGRGEGDWGISASAPDTCIQKMMQRLLMRHSKDMLGKPGLFRSQSMDDLDLSSTHLSPSALGSSSTSESVFLSGNMPKVALRRSESLDERHRSASDSDVFKSVGPPLEFAQSRHMVFGCPQMSSDQVGFSARPTGLPPGPSETSHVPKPHLPESHAFSPAGIIGVDKVTLYNIANPVATARAAFKETQASREHVGKNSEVSEFRSIVSSPLETELAEMITTRNNIGDRQNKRAKQSMAKWRRQSMIGAGAPPGRRAGISTFKLGVLGGGAVRQPVSEQLNAIADAEDGEEYDESMSPAVKTKSSTKKNRRVSHNHSDAHDMQVADRNSIGGADQPHASPEMTTRDPRIMQDSDESGGDEYGPGLEKEHAAEGDSHRHPEVHGLTEHTFLGIVVGGTYQQCFDDNTPVIAPSTGTKKHITRVHLSSNGSLELRLYIPSNNSHVIVDLGQQWHWMRTSPDGFLVFKEAIRVPMAPQQLFYYMQRHPLEWAKDCQEAQQSEASLLDTGGSEKEEDPRNGSRAAVDMDSSGAGAGGDLHDFSLLRSQDSSILNASAEHDGSHELGTADTDEQQHLGGKMSSSVSWVDGLNSSRKLFSGGSSSGGSHTGSSGGTHSGGSGGGLERSTSTPSVNFARVANRRASGRISVGAHIDRLSLSSPLDTSLTLNTPGGYHHDEMLSALGRGTYHDEGAMDLSISNAEDYDADRVNMVLYTVSSDWNQTSIVSCVLEFLLGDNGLGQSQPSESAGRSRRVARGGRRTTNKEQNEEDYTSYRKVSKAWALGSYRLLARNMSCPANTPLMPFSKWLRFANTFSWGKFLSSGACKRVYCVQNPAGLLEAVSVMNVEDLQARNMEGAISKELEISLACSSIASLNVCPNLVHVFSLFRSECPVPNQMWANVDSPPPPPPVPFDYIGDGGDLMKVARQNVLGLKKQHMDMGTYQYIRMEYCCGGDLEEHVRKNVSMSPSTVRCMLFQMCFALFSCREQLSLRHFDIKLLNFLVTSGSTLMPPDIAALEARRACSPFEAFRDPTDNVLEMCIGFGNYVYCLPLFTASKDLVKLADFGTSVVGAGGLGDPITVQQFTTLENTPPEFLLLGSMARQAFSADTFPLGLAYFHLLTGYEPYEALLADVYCPPYLLHQLRQVWSPKDVEDQYYVIQEVVNTCRLDAEDEVHAEGYDGAILCHTLYRYLVIFGAPEEWEAASLALDVCQQALGLPDNAASSRRMRRTKRACTKESESRMACQSQFQADHAIWGWKTGSHPLMRKVRERLQDMGKGAARLLERMTHFDPARRCTMFEALTSPLFAPLVDSSRGNDSRGVGYGHLHSGSTSGASSPRTSPRTLPRSPHGNHFNVKFMHYFRSLDDGGTEVLPQV